MTFLKILFFTAITLGVISCDSIKEWLNKKPKQEKGEAQMDQENTDDSWAKRSSDFLTENLKKPGVQSTASGLQYKVIKEGAGKKPSASSTVRVHYKGTLINGNEFDSSYKRNQPAEFGLNQVIAGWTEGLQLMKEGAVYEFYIPSRLAYGERASASIPASSTLIFQVELIKILN